MSSFLLKDFWLATWDANWQRIPGFDYSSKVVGDPETVMSQSNRVILLQPNRPVKT